MTIGSHTIIAHVLNKATHTLRPHGVKSDTLLLVTDDAVYMKKL
jgi:hypothetical protein